MGATAAMIAWLKRKLRGDDRKYGPWIMWLGWEYRSELPRHAVSNGGYHSLSLYLLFVDWARPARHAGMIVGERL